MRTINRTMAILLLIGAILTNTSVCLAADDAVVFDAAIEHLRNYLDASEVESAKSGFHDIKSGYEKAPLFEAYANAMLDIHSENVEAANSKLTLLGKDSTFEDKLEAYSLPTCAQIKLYINGRLLEKSGDFIAAESQYIEIMDIWDAFDRAVAMGEMYEPTYQTAQGKKASGEYAAAASIFMYLGDYKDSAEQYNECVQNLDSIEQENNKETNYEIACNMLESGDYENAASIFEGLGNYKDSQDRYNQAVQLMEDTNKEITYQNALSKLESGELDDAAKLFNSLGEYKDSVDQYNMIVQQKKENEQGKVLPLIANYYDGHTYAVFERVEYTWEQAEAYCIQLGGYLATIKSEGEQSFISTLISQGTKGTYWIGGKKDADGVFRWIDDNSRVDRGYTNWDTNQPDNENSRRHEDYMQILRIYNPDAGKRQDGTPYSMKNHWNNNENDNDYGTTYFSIHNVGFICEWDNEFEENDDLGRFARHIIKDGNYKIACFANEKYYLDISGSDIPAKAGSNVQLWYKEDGNIINADIWSVQYDNNDGYYRISQSGQDISLGVLDSSKERGADVRVWEYDDTSAQKWRIQQNDDGSYRIKAKCSGLSLDVSGGKFEKKTNVQQWDNHNDKPEKWMFVLYDENLYFIVNVQNSVNMREKPSTDSSILTEVPKGEEVRYTGERVDDFIGVEYNGQKGYILSKYLSHSK